MGGSSQKRKTELIWFCTRKTGKKDVIKSTKGNTKKKVAAKKGPSGAHKKTAAKRTLKPKGKKTAAAPKDKKSAAGTSPKKAVNESLHLPSRTRGMSFAEIIASAPKVAGVIAPPLYRPMQKHYDVTVEVEKKKVELVKRVMDFKSGQHVVAIIIAVDDTTQASDWLDMGADVDVMELPRESDWKEREVSGKLLGDVLDMSERNVQLLAIKGDVKKNGRGKYNLYESTQGYIQYLRDQASGRGGPELAGEKLETQKIDRMSKELDYYKKAELLCDVTGGKKAAIEFGLKVDELLGRIDSWYGGQLLKAKKRVDITKILKETRLRIQEELVKFGSSNGSGIK